MAESLKNKTIKGVGWTALGTGMQFAIQFIVSIILARLLTPDDYGLIGIITIFIVVADCITISGFFSSLIQKKEVTEADYSTMFLSNMASSTFLYILLFFAAPIIAVFFDRLELVSLVRAQALCLVVSAFSLVQRARLNKLLDFKTPTKILFVSSVVGGIIGITCAYVGFGVWALVISTVCNSTMQSLLYFLNSRWLPKMHFSTKSFKELFGYGWKILVAELFDSIYMQAYQLVVGKCYSPKTLGLYTRAKGFSDLISTNVFNITRGVTFPVLCQVRNEPERARDAYRRIIRMLSFITVVSSFMMFAVAKPMVLVLIGEKWLPSVEYLQILCFGALLYPINATSVNLLKSQGHSDKFLVLSLIRRVVEIVPICVGIFVNIWWMVIGMVVTNWFAFFLYGSFAGKEIKYSAFNQLRDMLPSFLIATLVAIPVWGVTLLPLEVSIIFPIQLCFGLVLVVIICECTRINEYIELKKLVLKVIKRKK